MKNIYYLENEDGQIVRAVNWDSGSLHVIYRLDTKRIETTSNLKKYDQDEIPYQLIETIKADGVKVSKKIKNTSLKLVVKSEDILPNVKLPEDDPEVFQMWLKKVSIGGACLMAFLFTTSFVMNYFKKDDPVLEIVQVIDREEIEKKPEPIVVAPSKKPLPKVVQPKKRVAKVKPRQPHFSQRGALGVLGSLNNSKQRGGLQLDAVGAGKGIGRGGSAGSGGVQKQVYAKGMFAAPLGGGNNPDGAGGYGTKGKGGGQAGYGKLSMVGSSKAYFEPVSSEAWIEGGLDPNEIAAVIQRHESEVRACYENGLQTQPKLSGRLSMKFLIGASGSVTTASVSNSSLKSASVENCIRNRLKAWKFPKPEGGVTVKVAYPFVLRRVSGS